MSIPPPSKRFKVNVICLSDIISDILKDVSLHGIDTTGMILGITVAKNLLQEADEKKLIDGFIERSSDYWEQIRLQDIQFLIDNCHTIFTDIPKEYIVSFSNLFKMKKVVHQNYIESIWKVLQAMVKICIKHVHQERQMIEEKQQIEGKTVVVSKYTKPFFPSLSLSKLKDLWEITLN